MAAPQYSDSRRAAPTILRPAVESWMRAAARAEQAAIEASIDLALARESAVRALPGAPRRPVAEQFEFNFKNG
jgi:hypothetical protein